MIATQDHLIVMDRSSGLGCLISHGRNLVLLDLDHRPDQRTNKEVHECDASY